MNNEKNNEYNTAYNDMFSEKGMDECSLPKSTK